MKPAEKAVVLLITIILFLMAWYFLFYNSYGSIKYVSNMVYPRAAHNAVLLRDGRVLIVNGYYKEPKAEIYLSKQHKSVYIGEMKVHHDKGTVTVLKDGRVLITGGVLYGGDVTNKAEVFDPKSGKFSFVSPMLAARNGHTATLLKDGRVLITGGDDSNGTAAYSKNSAEIFDPRSNTFQYTNPMHVRRKLHRAVLLQDGSVLIAGGGRENKAAEVYDPKKNSFRVIGNMLERRTGPCAQSLPNGNVFFAGGFDRQRWQELQNVEMYDFKQKRFVNIRNQTQVREGGACASYQNKYIFIAGGGEMGGFGMRFTPTTEVFDIRENRFYRGPNLKFKGGSLQATSLQDGTILISGGYNYRNHDFARLEIFTPKRKDK